jgi:cyanobactin maturation PatA/PatG family protease
LPNTRYDCIFMGAQSHHQLTAIRAALASAGPGSSEIRIGIVDGIPDLSHPCLRKAAIEIMDTMVPTDAGGADDHGTGICSLIFGSEATIFGLAPGCSGLVLPLFLRKGTDPAIRPVSQLDLARAITFALERGVSIINISAGQQSATTEPEAHLEQALRHCAERRVLLTAAAGNQGCACINLPAGVEIALAVGALDKRGQPLEVSNWAEPYRQNGLLAPGDELPVAVPGGNVSSASGTSFATAVVTGVAALLLSVARREGYRIDPLDVREILLESAAPCKLDGDGACDRYLAGTLDAASALAMLHRAGTSHSSFAAVQPNEFPQSGRGTFAMSIAGSSELSAVEAAGVSQSACSCETKSDEEAQAPKLTPQGALRAPEPAIPIKQNGSIEIGLTQQACSCGGGQPPQLVFALGALWFDFGTEARYDAIVQQIGDPVRANNPAELFAFLRENLHFASGLTFILMQEQIPLYAIQPAGPFALQIYSAMLDALESSLDSAHNKEQRVSIPGVIAGSTRLLNGMTVPVVFPDLRGMYSRAS